MAILVLISVNIACKILYPINNITKNWISFYEQDKNSIDVLIVGNSHAYSTFDIDILGEATGKKYYNLASNSQTVTQTYYNLKEALKYQKPELVILEATAIDSNNNWKWQDGEQYDKDWKKESNIDGMKFGLTKIEAICNQYDPQNWFYAGLKIARCHQYWRDSEQIEKNSVFYKEELADYSSYTPSPDSMSEEVMEQYKNAPTNAVPYYISDENKEHFYKLVELCKKKKINLCIIRYPSYDEYISHIDYGSEHDAIASLAKEADISFWDCNDYYSDILLESTDYENVYSAYHHLNDSGAKKTTIFIQQWLQKEMIK